MKEIECMLDEKNIKVASWIVARLQGEIRPEEEKALEDWIAGKREHREFYERMADREYVAKRLR